MPTRDEEPLPRPAEAIRGHPPALRPHAWHRGAQPVMEDGQLGGELLERDIERVNPEGTSDTSRPIDRPFEGD